MRLVGQISAAVRRKIDRMITVEDLPIGDFWLLVWIEEQTVKNHKPYAYRSSVINCKGQRFVVLSEKILPKQFKIVENGLHNKLAT